MGINRKKKQLWNEKQFRPQESGQDVSLKYLLTTIPILLFAVFAGYHSGVQNTIDASTTPSRNDITHLYIDDYRITFLPADHPDMEGLDGFTYNSQDNDIYIKKGLTHARTRKVCNHGLMHNLGIGTEHHDFINQNHGKVQSQVCNELMKRLEEIDGLP